MIRKKASATTDDTNVDTDTASVETRPQRNYVEIPLPKFSLDKNNYTPVLIVALLVASFLLGMLTTKIQYLEKGGTTLVQGTQNAGGTPVPQAAAPSQAPTKVDVKDGHLPPLGDKNAKVTIVEFSDFQCPFCKQFEDATFAQLKQAYIDTGKVKFVYRYFPLTSIHPNAQKSAEAAECANEQGKFWEYHDVLFKNQDTWAPKAAADAATDFVTYAGNLGLDTDQFSSCLNDGKYAKVVSDDAADGTTAGVTGTPAFFINGYLTVGALPFSSFQSAIDAQLK